MEADHTYFVYGTLMPQGLYWGRVADLVAWYEPAEVEGEAFDTGLGYPAAVFGVPGRVSGFLLHAFPGKGDLVRAIMDEIEDEGHEYRRVTVKTLSGVAATAYEWMGPTDGLMPILGTWGV